MLCAERERRIGILYCESGSDLCYVQKERDREGNRDSVQAMCRERERERGREENRNSVL